MKKTAIILFADLPDFEARRKSFCGFSSKKATQKLSSLLTQHFYKLAKQTNAETFLIDTYHQKGKSFGERISNAFADVFEKGYENVICIGNDCPTLQLKQLQGAINSLEQGNVVLGPTLDGGAYLIGMPKKHFHYSDFKKISWQNSKTFKTLTSFFNQTYLKLETLVDIDEPRDLSASDSSKSIVKLLLNTIQDFKSQLEVDLKCLLIEFSFISSSFLKGPPTGSF